MPPETRYARSGDLSIAYQVVGDGPFDVVFVPPGTSHVELGWEVPSTRALFEGIEQCGDFADVVDAKQELHDTVGKLIRRAQRAGAIRRGLDSRDIGALVGAAIQASIHAERSGAWRRYVQVVLDGLRP